MGLGILIGAMSVLLIEALAVAWLFRASRGDEQED